jgi:hypothetical protein
MAILSMILNGHLRTASASVRCENLEITTPVINEVINTDMKSKSNSFSVDEFKKTLEQKELEQIKESNSISQLLRSNTHHFWTWALERQGTLVGFQKEIMSFTGTIMGDAHLGNMHPVKDINHNFLVWKNIDLDDSGVGSFAFDFLHLGLSIKSINKEIKTKEMTEAYLMGLKQQDFDAPKSIRKYMEISMADYEKMRQSYVDRKTKNNQITLKKDEILEFQSDTAGISKNELSKIIKNNFDEAVKVLDLVILKRDRGGSVNLRRIWALLEFADGSQHIFEIKELAISSLEYYQPQSEIEENFSHNREYFGYSEKDLKLIEFANTHFIMREKKITLFDVPYDQKNKDEEKFLDDLATWGSYNLGFWQAKQVNSPNYTNYLNDNRENFVDLIKSLRKEYLKVLTGELENDKSKKRN